jgi:hypothetical protein
MIYGLFDVGFLKELFMLRPKTLRERIESRIARKRGCSFWTPNGLRSNVGRIFPSDPELRRMWHSAWDTYVVLCEPYNEVIRILEPQYRQATERIGEHAFGNRTSAIPIAPWQVIS